MLKTKEHLTALLFLACLVITSLALLVGLAPDYPQSAGMKRPSLTAEKTLPAAVRLPSARRLGHPQPAEPDPLLPQLDTLISTFESDLNTRLDQNHFFIQLYGGTQNLATRRVVEDVADPHYSVTKLKDGSLTFTNSYHDWDTPASVHQLLRLEGVLAQRDIDLLYVQAPQKIQGDGTGQLPYGVTDTNNECVDELLTALDMANVNTLDLREKLAEFEDIPWGDWFFTTDHHWTPEAAFTAYQFLCDYIETHHTTPQYSPSGGVKHIPYEIPDKFRDPDKFTKTTFEDYFLGSQGKRTGSLYAGVDDINMWVPKFATRFRYLATYGDDRVGSFAESLLFQERVEEVDWFNGNPYTLYSGGDYPIAHITNYYNPSGPKIMLIRDSFSCTLAPFLALPCSNLYTVDLRYFNEDLISYIDWLKPDMVFVLYAPGSARTSEMFDFFYNPSHQLTRPWAKAFSHELILSQHKGEVTEIRELSVKTLAKREITD